MAGWSAPHDCDPEPGNNARPDANAGNIGDTVCIRRPPRVFTDERGQTVWMSAVEPVELELDAVPDTDPYNSAPAVTR